VAGAPITGAIPSGAQPVLLWANFGPILAIHFLGTLGFSLAIPFLVFIVADLGGASWRSAGPCSGKALFT
jgi:hypothetical protein